MTGKDVVDRAYTMIADGGGIRNTVGEMVIFLNDGVRDLIARRPYLALNDDGSLDADYTDLTSGNYNTETLPFEEWIREPLAHYISYRVFELDAEDEANMGLSIRHQALYMQAT